MKKSLKEQMKGKIQYSWVGRIYIVKMWTLPKVIYRFSLIPINILMVVFIQTGKKNLKLTWITSSWLVKAILSKKEKQCITLPNLKLYHKTIVIKTAWYQYKNRYLQQWKRVEDPEINLHVYGQLIFYKVSRIHNGESTDSSTDGVRKAGYP